MIALTLFFVALVVYIYFLFSYVQNVRKECVLSDKNKDFADFYFYYLIIALVIGIAYPFITPFVKLSIKQKSTVYIGYASIMLVLNYFLYQFIDEVQDKCKNNDTLHNFGKGLRVFVIINIIGNSFGIINNVRKLAKTNKTI